MEECEALCTRITIMVNGRMVCLGTAQELKVSKQQECIPVGCVLPAVVAVGGGGDVRMWLRVCLVCVCVCVWVYVYVWGWCVQEVGCVCPGGVCVQEGDVSRVGCLARGVNTSPCGQDDRCL